MICETDKFRLSVVSRQYKGTFWEYWWQNSYESFPGWQMVQWWVISLRDTSYHRRSVVSRGHFLEKKQDSPGKSGVSESVGCGHSSKTDKSSSGLVGWPVRKQEAQLAYQLVKLLDLTAQERQVVCRASDVHHCWPVKKHQVPSSHCSFESLFRKITCRGQ